MFKKTLCTALLALTIATPAAAATLKLTATALNGGGFVQNSDFSIIFDDADGDMKLSMDEVVSFSGYTNIQLGISYSELLRISPIPAETDEPVTFTSGGFALNTWLFGEGSDRGTAQPSSFSYSVAVVPLPASALLLLAGLGGFAAMRRRS